MLTKLQQRWLLALFGLVSHSVLALTELAPIESLPPIPAVGYRGVGWEWHYIDQDGKPGHMRKVAGTSDTASYIRSDGCKWTRPILGFAPAIAWDNCPSSGKSEVKLIAGKIWPLKLGNTFAYQIQGASSLFSKVWKAKRKCKVDSQVKIQTVSGIHDTFKLVCKERWGTRTWWLSPKVGTAVAYQQKTIRGKLIIQEMTKIVTPKSTPKT